MDPRVAPCLTHLSDLRVSRVHVTTTLSWSHATTWKCRALLRFCREYPRAINDDSPVLVLGSTFLSGLWVQTRRRATSQILPAPHREGPGSEAIRWDITTRHDQCSQNRLPYLWPNVAVAALSEKSKMYVWSSALHCRSTLDKHLD